ncbi:Stk1 family PASTA domain-containing Ser/Thr kinase [Clostridium sp. SHJSY1]|uniref:Stk1 family PASTA domain-containing Ser/Thr kinase n=1 Tax=Clostridium sp. SHJSY1 TaxID=2942483 RepID=UPI002875D221|nr:Stk1 family PASTA domain-containing Ser/Thr kinase [Clostridium sp. SHJSY1]MDS0524940.1 Stk1 family PASTA domain-containing Ser/Thr kinase [Clostridium sp. SHJSY1]
MIGEILGNRYEILEQIGEGGMAIVYKALDNKLSRNVAVKVLKNELSDNEDIVNKFKREATAIATLSDVNIVNVLDVGNQDGANYIVMEYVKGKTLKEVIVDFGKLNYETTIRIGTQIAKALDCAHKNNIIHRDVKPQNVLVTEDGLIKVTDFGIAKFASSATLTNTTTIMGSAQYLSPEQARGSRLDTRTDIYSLGIVLYEMVTGRLPFEADSPVTIALKHIQEDVVPPKELNPALLDSLNKLILKAMEKDADKRYQTAKELISDLDRIKENPNVVIDKSQNGNDGQTMVMKADKTVIMKALDSDNDNLNSKDEEYYDEDEDYYDEDEEQKEDKSKKDAENTKKVKKVVEAPKKEKIVETPKKAENKVTKTNSMNKNRIIIGFIAIAAIFLVFVIGAKFLSKKGTTDGTNATNVQATNVKVPDVEEQSLEKAKQILEKNNLKNYEVKNKPHNSVASGYVINTNPTADTEIASNAKIIIYVSNGPANKNVTIPDESNKTLDEATEDLSSLGLTITSSSQTTNDQSKDGKVASTSPSAGKVVKSDVKVTINYYKYKAGDNASSDNAKPSPDSVLKVGMTEAEALAAIENGYLISYRINGSSDGTLTKWEEEPYKNGTRVILTFGGNKKDNTDTSKSTDSTNTTDSGNQ